MCLTCLIKGILISNFYTHFTFVLFNRSKEKNANNQIFINICPA